MVRYNTDGSLDGSFNGGIVTTPVTPGSVVTTHMGGNQTDGKIIAAG